LPSNCLSLQFQATECNGWPKIRILIDNDVIEEYQFDQATALIDIPIDLVDGDHVLAIERYDKTNHNIVFTDGKILQDQSVTLLDMYVDGIKLPEMFKYDSKFCYNDLELISVLAWGPNGVWTWRFSTPLLQNLIDRRNAGVDSPSLVIPNSNNVTELLEQIQKFKNTWL
jgi:hypothetical protein